MTHLPSALQSIVTANSAIYGTPLTGDSVRILQLHPGLDDEPICCTFTVVDLAEAEPFDALSYYWGKVAAKREITCNGQLFRPTENLYAAVQQLRLPSRVRYMWVDA